MTKSSGVVNIRGKEYRTVALRVSEFRETHPIEKGWRLQTELVTADEKRVVMRATIINPDGVAVGTGYAEEFRGSSQINRTSALENCETSAIGRALAACGFGGSEYASANEVEQAIHQQQPKKRQAKQQTATVDPMAADRDATTLADLGTQINATATRDELTKLMDEIESSDYPKVVKQASTNLGRARWKVLTTETTSPNGSPEPQTAE